MSLHSFLAAHQAQKGGVFTHTAFGGGNGSFFIPEDEMDEFYQLYVEHIENNQGPLHLTEKPTPIGKLRVDLDFIYSKEITKHQHTQDQVLAFVKAYMTEAQKLLDLPKNAEIFVMEKVRPTLDEKGRSKSGVHLVVPGICTNSLVQQSIRRSLLPRMPEIFPGLPLTIDWENVYDKAVLSNGQQWMLYESQKAGGLPYKIAYIADWEGGEVSLNTQKPGLNVELIKKLSIRAGEEDSTPMTEAARKMYQDIQNANDRISAGRAVTPARGRPATRGPVGNSRGSSPGAEPRQRNLNEEEKSFIKSHLNNLAETRATDYKDWQEVGQCLKNIHVDLLDAFLDFSSRCAEKFNEGDCIQKWNGFTFRYDGQRLGIGSLLFWSKTDNPEGYKDIMKNHVVNLIEASSSGTEYDVARVVHAHFRDDYKCAKFANNVWYRFTNHIWEETDRGVHLQCKLSTEIWEIYRDYIKNVLGKRIEAMPKCEHEKPDLACTFCQLLQKEKLLHTVCTNLRRTKFKDNVMKECRELFLDEQFGLKADENCFLIAFNNGVYDMTPLSSGTRVGFRNGRPEDYITLTAKVDFDPEKEHYQHACWPEIEKFLASILPDPEVRVFFLKHLATCIMGGNPSQKFYILTGSGSNGKSMLFNLVKRTLGDYACSINISILTQGRQKSGSAQPDVIRMKGKRFITMQEPDEGVALNTGLMKEWASNEAISARDLYGGAKSMVDFKLQAKFHLACNEKPKIQTTDGGTWRRLGVIDFPNKFVAQPRESYEKPLDESLQLKVESQAWAECFLRYLVHLFEEGNGFPGLQPPAKIMEYTNEYQAANDCIARFIQEHVVAVDTTQEDAPYPELITKPEIASQFREWKKQNEIVKGSPDELYKRVEARYGKYPRGGWSNFRINRLI